MFRVISNKNDYEYKELTSTPICEQKCTTEEAVLPGLVASYVILIFRTHFSFLYFIPQLVAVSIGSSKSESQGAEGGHKVELGDTDKKVTFDLTQTRVDNLIIQVMESGKHDMYAIDTHTEYVLD